MGCAKTREVGIDLLLSPGQHLFPVTEKVWEFSLEPVRLFNRTGYYKRNLKTHYQDRTLPILRKSETILRRLKI
jgi:hypothetical protein